ncbi:hypothetical protein IT882_05705 [Microbacterium schleiferi]|uniref:GIY-YIG catalytic domain-containing protein n=1 Tax=Microbacterium schleiferi TaxID=69362 RepID=A0A7S8RIK5_9MICO|nr:hypothetical protein [Microbacterium schleiferi]QPE05511.1 hypothetical protein IT882_05705 [Microbacterium schleiferi]
MNLLEDGSFRPAGEIDAIVPNDFGVYAIRLRVGSSLPEPFPTHLASRRSRLIYIGKATSLLKRMLRNELRGRGHGTFFRSIGAVLGYRPVAGSLVGKANQYNFSFVAEDRARIVAWIDENLEVSWAVFPEPDVREAEKALILKHTPLLNLDGNPLALAELDALRIERRTTAAGLSTPAL